MLVYVVRHAAAGQRGDEMDDGKRRLTKKGIESMRLVAKALAAMGIAPAKVYTSPLIRARQTAEILAKALGREAALEELEDLGTGHSASDVVAFLAEQSVEEVAIVGHEPQLGEVVSLMVVESDEPVVDMKKASVACIEFPGDVEAGQGVVAWHLVPRVVEALYGK